MVAISKCSRSTGAFNQRYSIISIHKISCCLIPITICPFPHQFPVCGFGRYGCREIIPYIISQMRRLIVTTHLPNNGLTILRIVHQCINTVCCCRRCHIDTQTFIIGGAHNKLFAPVAQHIHLNTRSPFSPVIGQCPRSSKNRR